MLSFSPLDRVATKLHNVVFPSVIGDLSAHYVECGRWDILIKQILNVISDDHSKMVITEGEQERLGEAWNSGAVVLSWEDVRFGAADCCDGHNVVLHEFAHQLDMENNVADGAPLLPRRSMYVAWARVLGREYEELQRAVAKNHRTVMDEYGAIDPAEFFAVATETFFEKPAQLNARHPELYEQLREFYQQDPLR